MITQDHVVGGGVATIVTTNLPAVLSAAHWFGPGAPVENETALLLAVGYGVVAIVRWLRNRPAKPAPAPAPARTDPIVPRPAPPAQTPVPAAAPAATPAAPPAQPAPQA